MKRINQLRAQLIFVADEYERIMEVGLSQGFLTDRELERLDEIEDRKEELTAEIDQLEDDRGH